MQKHLQKIHEAFSKFEGNKIIPVSSDGDWSMHQLLEYLLGLSGPANVWISSFSITEVAIRSFLQLQEKGFIRELHCLFDFTVKHHKIGLLFFLNNVVTDVVVTKCHAKLILIENENCTIAVVGSANFNVNDKKEVAVIHFEKWFFDFYLGIIQQWMEAGIKIQPDEFN
jgi:hypothetical protein